MSITLDFLPNHQDIKLYQDDEMFRINTDTFALGEFLNIYKQDTVLDIGTNTGSLLLYASIFNPKKLIGIDINEKALELAKKNMELNNISNYSLIHADANNYIGEEVDVVICNPPYFKQRVEDRGNNKYLRLAKHEENLPLCNLIKTINRNLKCNGKLFFLFQTSRLFEVYEEFKKNNLVIKELKYVYDINKDSSNDVLIKAVKCGKNGVNVLKPLIIER